MSKNIVEMINALNTQHKYAIADAVNNVDIPEEYNDTFEIITRSQLRDYFAKIGWNPGKYKRTHQGTEYEFGADDTYALYNFPFENLTAKGKKFKIITASDSTSINLYFDYDSMLVPSGGTLTPTSTHTMFISQVYAYQREVFMTFTSKYISVVTYGPGIQAFNDGGGVLNYVLFNRYTNHLRMDRAYQVRIDNDGISISNGINYDSSKGSAAQKFKPQITLGSTTINETKLQALLALLNQ